LIGGLFGGVLGGGPDPADVRQQELLKRLDGLKDDIKEVKDGIQQIQQGQLLIVSQVREVKEALKSMEINAAARHTEIIGKLDEIYRQQLTSLSG
jgi:hypothetical protein